MQLGVYLKYLDEKEIYVGRQEAQGDYWLLALRVGGLHEKMESFQEAIEQAFKIREQELTNKQK